MIGYSPNRKKRIKQNWEGPFKNTGQKKKEKNEHWPKEMIGAWETALDPKIHMLLILYCRVSDSSPLHLSTPGRCRGL